MSLIRSLLSAESCDALSKLAIEGAERLIMYQLRLICRETGPHGYDEDHSRVLRSYVRMQLSSVVPCISPDPVLEEVQAVVQELTLQAASAQLQTQQADYEAAFAKLKSAGPAEGEVGSVVAAKSGNATAGGAAPAVEATSVGEAVAAAVAS
eukprot:4999796-Pleurochrysis_carterae.AAC.2